MKKKNLNDVKTPEIVFDKRLDKYNDKNLFPEKLARANEIIAKYGLPDIKQTTK